MPGTVGIPGLQAVSATDLLIVWKHGEKYWFRENISRKAYDREFKLNMVSFSKMEKK